MQILTMGCFAPYLDAALREDRTEERSKQLLQCLKPYRDHLPEKWFKTGYHHFLTAKGVQKYVMLPMSLASDLYSSMP